MRLSSYWQRRSTLVDFLLMQMVPQFPPDAALRTFAMPQRGVLDNLWTGFSGRPRQDAWFVVVGYEPNLEDAKRRATEINADHKGFKAEVYKPYRPPGPFALVIGANLDLSQARELRQKAIAEGVSQATALWTFPK